MRMIVVKDDLDHLLDADEIVELTLDGVTYTLDLAAKNAAKLRVLLRPWLEAAHDRTKPKAKKGDSAAERRKAIREWGAANGHTVGQGRLSRALIEAYEAAQSA